MSIRLRKATIAAAIEDVAQPQSAQEGSYQGPRILSDAPVQAVLDLSSVRAPIEPNIQQFGAGIGVGGPNYLVDLPRGEDGQVVLDEAPDDKQYSFLRTARIFVGNSGGTTGNVQIRIRVVTDYTPSGADIERAIFFRAMGAGDVVVIQYGYDMQDQSGPNEEIIEPPGFVFPPSARMVLEVDNGTDDNVSINVFSWGYTFDATDILI